MTAILCILFFITVIAIRAIKEKINGGRRNNTSSSR